jgi:hypothetical protein
VAEVARIAGPLGAAGLALLILATSRNVRLAGLAAWAAGMLGLAAYLAPSSSHTRLAAGAVGLIVFAAVGAWLLVRTPWLLPFAVIACGPARIPVSVGGEDARLLLPLYAVIGALALALAWELLREEDRGREFGPIGVALAAFLVWTGLTLAWTNDLRRGAIFAVCFALPFALLALGLARLPWRGRWFLWLWGVIAGTALVYAAVGAYQWATRDIFWNTGLSIGNTYAAFFRVNSLFWDPSIYGRYLVVGILVSLPALLLKPNLSGRQAAGVAALIAATSVGLFLSFSQSSFVALAAGVLVAAAAALGRRAALVAAAAAVVALGVMAFGFSSVRHDLVEHSRSGINRVTRGRAELVSQGTRIALAHPVSGVGLGGFREAYAKRAGFTGRKLKAAASHTTPVTVAAEEGLVGLALFAWLLGAAFVATLRRLGYGFTSRISLAIGLVLVAIAVHSLFYNAFFEDPMMWAALGLVGVAARAPRKPAEDGIALGGDDQSRQHEAGERVGEVRGLEDPAQEEQHEDGDRVADRAGPDGARPDLVPDEQRGER